MIVKINIDKLHFSHRNVSSIGQENTLIANLLTKIQFTLADQGILKWKIGIIFFISEIEDILVAIYNVKYWFDLNKMPIKQD